MHVYFYIVPIYTRHVEKKREIKYTNHHIFYLTLLSTYHIHMGALTDRRRVQQLFCRKILKTRVVIRRTEQDTLDAHIHKHVWYEYTTSL